MTETATKTDELCRQSIQAYLDLKGIPYTQEDHYLRLKDHDSLVVDTRVTPSKPYETFYWNSRGVGGNLFHFLHQYEGLDGSTAMKTLEKIRPALSQHKKNMSQVVESKPRVYEQWRWRGRQPTHASFDYLTKTRKLSPKLIQGMYKVGLLRELRNGDAFFVWYDHQHKEVGGDEQGTSINYQKFGKRGTRKKVAWGAKKHFGFHFSVNFGNQPERLYVFESPIDALSFAQMHAKEYHGKQRFLSLNGSGSKVETITKFIGEFGVPKELHLGLDTDLGGFNGVLKARKQVEWLKSLNIPALNDMKLVIDQPDHKYKDWNEQLQKNQDKSLHQQSFEKFYQENKNRFMDKEKAKVHTQKQSQNQSPMFKSYTHAMQH